MKLSGKQQHEVVGVDLGGTSIKAGRVEDRQLVSVEKYPTPGTASEQEVTTAVIETIRKVIRPTTSGIGIGVPSVVDTASGIVFDVANIPSWKEVPVKKILEEEFQVPVHVNNDANCFAYGEKIYGKGKNYQHFVGITLGTGVGAGIVQDGQLLQDANCGAGEFGIVPYLDSDYEHYCGSMFFENQGTTGEALYQRAVKGDKKAIELFDELGFHMAQLIKLVVATVDPQMIVFGGSIAASYNLFEKAMRAEMPNFAFPNSMKKLAVEVSEIRDQGIFGAAALCY